MITSVLEIGTKHAVSQIIMHSTRESSKNNTLLLIFRTRQITGKTDLQCRMCDTWEQFAREIKTLWCIYAKNI